MWAALLFFGLSVAAWLLSTAWYHRLRTRAILQTFGPNSADAQAIVVLGNNPPPVIFQWCNQACFPLFDPNARMRSAAQGYQRTNLPLLLTGGKTGQRTESEARSMQRGLQERYQISTDWLEELSHTTLENAKYSAELLGHKQITHILVATHPWHFQRAALLFQQYGIKADLCFDENLTTLFPETGWHRFSPQKHFTYLAYLSAREWVARRVARWQALVGRQAS